MKALVTGGTGFVGSHLIDALLRRGDTVTALVRTPAKAAGLATRGVRLVDEYRKGGIGGVSPNNVPAADRTKIEPVIQGLIDQLDAVSDLLVAESVHQLVGGNVDGSAAAMAALDKQTRPPEPRVVDTPHSTRGYTQRVVAVMQSANAGAWALLNDLPAQVEPRLNAWIARWLGDPARYVFGARVLERVDTGEKYDGRTVFRWDDKQSPLSASIDELGLSPLSLITAEWLNPLFRPSQSDSLMSK